MKDHGMILRKTQNEDIDRVMEIIHMASAYMKAAGINQWNDGYPARSQFLEDMERGESYVCQLHGKVVATAALSMRAEPNYRMIYDGQWRCTGPYGVIHRIAVDDCCKGRGIAGLFVDFLEEMCIKEAFSSIRVDTHEDNRVMQHFLKKRGFCRCGIIFLPGGAARVAFEKPLRS